MDAEALTTLITDKCLPETDGQGFVDLLSITSALSSAGLTVEAKDLEALIATLHIEANNGKVNLLSFLQQGAALLPPLLQTAQKHSQESPALSAVEHASKALNQVNTMREIFNLCDRNGDGKIFKADLHELVQRLQGVDPTKVQLPPDPTSIDLLMAQLDVDGKGYVDFDDFLNGSLKATQFDVPGVVHTRPQSPAPIQNAGASATSSPYKTTPIISISGRSGVDDVFAAGGSPLGNSVGSPNFSNSHDDRDVERLRAANHSLSLKLSSLESQLSQSQTAQGELLGRVQASDAASTTIKKQSKQLSTLEDERRQLVEELESLKVTVQDIKNQLRDATKKESDLNLEKQSLNNELLIKQRELNDAADELRQLRSTPTESSKADNGASSAVAELQAKIEGLLRDKGDLESKIGEITALNESLVQQKDTSDSLLEEAKKKISDLEEGSIVQGGAKRNAGKSLLSDLEGSLRAQSQPQLEGLEQAKNELLQRIASLEQQLEAASQSKNEELEKQKAEFEQKLADLEEERKGLFANVETANEQLAKGQELNEQLKQQVEALNAKGQLFDADKTALDAKLAALEEEKAQNAAKLAAIEQQLKDSEAGQSEKSEDSLAKERELAARVAQLEVEKGVLDSQLAELTAEKSQLESANAGLESERSQLNEKISQLEQQSAAVEAAKKAELEAFEANLKALEEDQATLKAKLDEADQLTARLQAEKAQDEKTIQELNDAKSSLESQKAQLEEQHKQKEAEIQQQLRELQEKFDQLAATPAPVATPVPTEDHEVKFNESLAEYQKKWQAEQDQAIAAEQAKWRELQAQLEAQNAKLQEQLKEIDGQYKAVLEKLQEAEAQKSQQQSADQDQALAAEQSKWKELQAQLEAQNSKLTESHKELDGQYQSALKDAEALKAQQEALEAQHKAALAKLQDAEALKAQQEALEAQHKDALAKLQDAEALKASQASLEAQHKAALARLSESQLASEQQSKLQEQFRSLQDQHNQALTKLKESEEAARRAQQALQDAAAKPVEVNASPLSNPTAELDDLKHIKSSLEDEVRKLREQLEAANVKIRAAKRAPGSPAARRSSYSSGVEEEVVLDETPLIDKQQALKREETCCSACSLM